MHGQRNLQPARTASGRFAGIGRCAEGNMLRTLFSATILVGALAGPVMAHPGATQVESPGTALVGDDSRYDR